MITELIIFFTIVLSSYRITELLKKIGKMNIEKQMSTIVTFDIHHGILRTYNLITGYTNYFNVLRIIRMLVVK